MPGALHLKDLAPGRVHTCLTSSCLFRVLTTVELSPLAPSSPSTGRSERHRQFPLLPGEPVWCDQGGDLLHPELSRAHLCPVLGFLSVPRQGGSPPESSSPCMMVNVMCQLDWPREPRLNILGASGRVFQMSLASESVDSVSRLPSPTGWSLAIPSTTWREPVSEERGIHPFFSCPTD